MFLYSIFTCVWIVLILPKSCINQNAKANNIQIKKALVLPGFKWAGPITPLGGACFISGWICLALGIKK